MKRGLPPCLSGVFEVAVFHKIPKKDSQEEPIESLKFEFTPTEEHLAAVDLLYKSAVEFSRSKLSRTMFRAFGGMTFGYQFTDDLMEGEHDPYCNGVELLREMVNKVEGRIERWLKYIDTYVFNAKTNSISFKYINCLAWTSKGTVNYAESARNLLKTDLSIQSKVIVACVHCLVDEVENFFINLKPYQFTNLYEKTKVAKHFWKNHLANKEKGDGTLKVDERLLHAVGYENQDAVLFVWNHMDEEAKQKNLVKLMEECDVDLQVKLLSQLNGKQQLDIFAKCGDVIVRNMMNDFVWDKYIFVAVHFARDVIPNHQYYLILKKASVIAHEATWSSKSCVLFDTLWKKAPQRVKDYIFNEIQDTDLFWYIGKEPSVNDIAKLFDEASPIFRQRLLESSDGIRMCQELLSEEEMDFVKSLVDQAFLQPVEAYAFKKKLMKYDMKPLMYSLSQTTNLEELDAEIKWYFATESEINKYKKNFFKERYHIRDLSNWLREAFFENLNRKNIRDQANFSKLDALLVWFNLTESELQNVKDLISSEDAFKDLTVELIQKERYDLADQLMQWCFGDENAIKECKASFYRYDVNSSLIDVVYDLIWKEDDLKTLDKFVDWLYVNPADKISFKNSIIERCKKSNNKIWGSLLYLEKFELADRLLKWALNDDEKIIQFKKDLLLEIDLEYVTERVKRIVKLKVDEEKEKDLAYATNRCKNIVRWFNPSLLTFAKYRKKHLANTANNKKFNQLIKEYSETQ